MQSPPEDCLFCRLVVDGPHVARAKGLVAVKDIHPQAPVHLLVIPEQHVDSFREIGEFSARDSKHMLEFVAEMAQEAGLSDYRVQVNVGASAGQTVFHLHWHVLGTPDHLKDGTADVTAVSEL